MMQSAGQGAGKKPDSGFRGDVEGLRAVAIVSVVLGHLTTWLPGGFVGVDVFFVISGYLITGLLLREYERTGRISFRGFYARRARRILPAALLVLGTTVLLSELLFSAVRTSETRADVAWSLGFLANIHFAAIGTDYFQSARPPSPVQHFWSLAVEEQFYLFWPLLLIMVLGLARRRSGTGTRVARVAVRTAPAVAILTVVLGSVGWSLHQTADSPTSAYFSTPARAFELGIGALVGVAAPLLSRVPRGVRAPGGLLGLTGIVCSAVLLRPGSSFPGPLALAPDLACALVIASGTGSGRWPGSILLTNPVTRYVGRVSYSLYLWHWPVLVILAAVVPEGSGRHLAVAVPAMAALAIASYHFVEAPLRHISWSRWSRGGAGRWRAGTDTAPRRQEHRLAGVGAQAFATAAAVLWVVWPQPAPTYDYAAPTATRTLSPAERDVDAAPVPDRLRHQITAALRADRWPTLRPSLDHLDTASAPEWTACGNVDRGNEDGCVFPRTGPTKPRGTVVVLGDSFAIHWLPGIRAALEPEGWRVRGLTWGQCPAADVAQRAPDGAKASFPRTCSAHRDWSLREVARLEPDLVVVSGEEDNVDRAVGARSDSERSRVWRSGMTKSLEFLVRHAGRVVVLAPPPEAKNLQICATAVSAPADCTSSISDNWWTITRANRAAAKRTGADFVDTHLWFCGVHNWCPPFIGHVPVRVDGGHLSAAYSRGLGPLLRPILLATR